jgi:hypothetical protein
MSPGFSFACGRRTSGQGAADRGEHRKVPELFAEAITRTSGASLYTIKFPPPWSETTHRLSIFS